MNIEKLVPGFNFGKPNEDVVLLENEPAEIITDKGTIQGTGRGILSLGRKASVCVEMPLSSPSASSIVIDAINAAKEAKLKLINNKTQINGGAISSYNFPPATLTWRSLQEPFCVNGDENTEVEYISFHLFNFVDFFTNNMVQSKLGDTGFCLNKITVLKWNDWEISIKSIKETADNIKHLKENGGYAITHVGMIQRLDSTSFKINDVKDLRSGLAFFLSFAIGRICYPNLCVGYKNEQKVYEDWELDVAPWSDVNTWWHGTSSNIPIASILEAFFPLFMKKWIDMDWKRTLSEVIHLYVNSNDTDKIMVEPALVLLQAAMERLAAQDGYNNGKASDKFRSLFTKWQLSLIIPSELQNLHSVATLKQFQDIPHTLIEVRNSITHAVNKLKGTHFGAIYEAWYLYLEYIELLILGICGYNGQYQSRVKRAELTGPWK